MSIFDVNYGKRKTPSLHKQCNSITPYILRESYKNLAAAHVAGIALEDYMVTYGVNRKVLIEGASKEMIGRWKTSLSNIWERIVALYKKAIQTISEFLDRGSKWLKKNERNVLLAIKEKGNVETSVPEPTLTRGSNRSKEMLAKCVEAINALKTSSGRAPLDQRSTAEEKFFNSLKLTGSKKDKSGIKESLMYSYGVEKTKNAHTVNATIVSGIIKTVYNKNATINTVQNERKLVVTAHKATMDVLKQLEKATSDNVEVSSINEALQYSNFILGVSTAIGGKSIDCIRICCGNAFKILREVVAPVKEKKEKKNKKTDSVVKDSAIGGIGAQAIRAAYKICK